MKYLFPLFAFFLFFSYNSQNAQSSQPKYAAIRYTSTSYLDFDPVFTMTLNPDRTAVLEAEHYNFPKLNSENKRSQKREGTFETTIKKEDYNKLVYLLNGIDFKNLPPYRSGNNMVNGRSTAILKLQRIDGTSEKIEDYGKNKTEKLAEVYKFIENLRYNQQWTKVK